MIGEIKSMQGAWAGVRANDHDGSLYGSILVVIAACIGAVAVLFSSGCSGPARASAVDAPRAREALKTALDHWKSGQDSESLQSSATPMVAQDFDWTSGANLLDYEIIDERLEDVNLRVQVKIKLTEKGKTKAVEKKASYVIGTSPRLTVFRDVMRH
jgi:hypothetical protein